MKKIISLLLSALLVTTLFTALPFTADAAETDSAKTGNGDNYCYPLDIDLSGGSAAIGKDTYDYLVGLMKSGYFNGVLKANTADEYIITFADGADILLTPTRIYTYDYEYAPSYSIELQGDYIQNPVNFIFAENQIYQSHVDLTLPEVGSAWDFAAMQAELTPTGYDWNLGRFTVTEGVWYDHWGLSMFDTFEGGEQYFVEFTLAPNDNYYFTMNSEAVIHVPGMERGIYLKPLYMNADGSVHYGNGNDQIRFVGGEPHSITVNQGYADVNGKVVTEAVPGQLVTVRLLKEAVGDNMYVVMGSDKAFSADVEVSASEAVGDHFFYMPKHDVTVDFTYDAEEQLDLVWDLYNGAVTVSDDHTQRSVALGAYNLLHQAAEKTEYVDADTYYDIDGNGSYDIKRRRNVFSLMSTNSLTNNIKLQPGGEETLYYSVRSITIQVKQPVKHKITVSGGVASAKCDAFANDYVITEAYEGETVFVMPNATDIDDDSYVAQFSMRATSNDVEIDDEAGISFTMPDKDVTVRLDYDCCTQDVSVFDFRYAYSVTLTDDGTGPRSEVYGVSMLIRLLATGREEVSESACRYDLNADGIMDIEQNSNDNSYTLLGTHSLQGDGMTLTLSREQSWTLPIRTLYLVLHTPAPPLRGDVNFDGKVTIEDATLIQLHLAEFLNPNNGPLIDETDPEWFYRADANNDGRISIMDVTAIQRCVAEIEELMP